MLLTAIGLLKRDISEDEIVQIVKRHPVWGRSDSYLRMRAAGVSLQEFLDCHPSEWPMFGRNPDRYRANIGAGGLKAVYEALKADDRKVLVATFCPPRTPQQIDLLFTTEGPRGRGILRHTSGDVVVEVLLSDDPAAYLESGHRYAIADREDLRPFIAALRSL